MEDQFTAIAPIYDRLMSNIPYRDWVAYVKALARRREHRIHRVLDVGCGTGNVSLLLAASGCEVTGIDVSPEMIEVAKKKAANREEGFAPVTFLAIPAEEMDLQDRFDTAVSLFDSVNYITDPAHLQEAIRRVFRHLVPGGLFIFDMNTPYALEMEMFTQDNLQTSGEPKYVWRSHYDWRSRMTVVNMKFYVKQGNTRVIVQETHRQRAYTLDEMRGMLENAGFDVLDLYDAFTFRAPISTTDRAYFVARRPSA